MSQNRDEILQTILLDMTRQIGEINSEIEKLEKTGRVYSLPRTKLDNLRFYANGLRSPTLRVLTDTNDSIYYDPVSDTWRKLFDDTLTMSYEDQNYVTWYGQELCWGDDLLLWR